VVDDDIDPTNLEEVVWAMCTRCDPAMDIDVLRKAWGSPADPLLVPGQPPYNSRAIIDACRPYERIKEFPRVAEASPELLRQMESQWAGLFANRPGPAPGVGGAERVAELFANGAAGAPMVDDAMARVGEAPPTDMAAGERNS
jgi:hypothetical protein